MAARLVPLEPPGTHCQHQAVFDALRRIDRRSAGRTFVEVGCGDGSLAAKLCDRGYRGVGVDFAERALAVARDTAAAAIDRGSLELRRVDLVEDPAAIRDLGVFDVALSMMVMEHVEDDALFLRRLTGLAAPGGHVVLGVPGRMDRWSIEDDQVGHVRRYERHELADRLAGAGLEDVVVWSVSVPVANLLHPLGTLLMKRASAEGSRLEKTRVSGLRRIPLKTAFPPVFRWVLNRRVLSPLFLLQRLFYSTSLGLTLIGFGRRPA